MKLPLLSRRLTSVFTALAVAGATPVMAQQAPEPEITEFAPPDLGSHPNTRTDRLFERNALKIIAKGYADGVIPEATINLFPTQEAIEYADSRKLALYRPNEEEILLAAG